MIDELIRQMGSKVVKEKIVVAVASLTIHCKAKADPSMQSSEEIPYNIPLAGPKDSWTDKLWACFLFTSIWACED